MSLIRELTPTNKLSSPYRRSQTAVTFADVTIMTESPRATGSNRLLRKHSFGSLFGGPNEVWPESITGLLTGGQLLIDRSMLFSLLEEELNGTKSRMNGLSCSGQNHDCREKNEIDTSTKKTFGLSMLSGGVSIPRPDKKWG